MKTNNETQKQQQERQNKQPLNKQQRQPMTKHLIDL